MKRNGRLLLALLSVWLIASDAASQQTLIHEKPEAIYREAMELYQREKYAWAREKFLLTSEAIENPASLLRERAEYYAAVCGYELFNNNADLDLGEFVAANPVSTLAPLANFQLARMEYRKGSFNRAINHFSAVEKKELSREERDEYDFKLGYSYLRTEKYEQARKHLTSVKDPTNLYSAPARYFLAHINYLEKNYPEAIKGFSTLKEDETFKAIVPYYLIQIYYLTKRYDELAEQAPALLASASARRAPEIARMTGDALFTLGKYPEAIPYLEQYMEKSSRTVERQDHYQLGLAYYKTAAYDKAISELNLATGPPDSLSQNALYHLGDAYLKTAQKRFALNAFYAAQKDGEDAFIREDALFNYAKLSYELGYDPYNEAIKALRQYLNDYPSSTRADEANTYLVNLYMSTRNYKAALASIDKVQNKSLKLKEVQQRLAYFQGIEEFNSQEFPEAMKNFTLASASNLDKQIKANSLYWIGESFFRLKQYDEAADSYKDFLLTPGAFGSREYYLANYNLGYCYFKTKNYDKALVEFRKFLTNKDKSDRKVVNDAYLRSGDCFFVTRRFEEAAGQYDLAYNMRNPDADYALFQKALAQGADGKLKAKTGTLEKLIREFAKSPYQPEARYELGIAFLLLNDDKEALRSFTDLISLYPGSHFVKNALLRKGLILYNQNDNEEALRTFKKVVTDFPSTPESREALVSIRNIYVDLNQVDDFFLYAKNIPFANVTNTEQDSLTFLAAENRYMSGDCNTASRGLTDYLSKFPQGAFRTNADFYLAECLFRENSPDKALSHYLAVIAAPQSRFTETALLHASAIEYSRKDYDNALQHFRLLKEKAEDPNNLLTAQTGIMRCSKELGNPTGVIEAAGNLLANPKVSDELAAEAHLSTARAARKLGDADLAKASFRRTLDLTQNELGAEAKYHLALIQYEDGKYKDAEKTVFEFINEFPSYDYWLARSFILLADVYVKTDNSFQAKQTLQSIIDNYEGPELVDIAKQKLNEILEAERKATELKAEENRKAGEQEMKKETQDLIEEK